MSQDMRMQFLGCLGLLGECSVHVDDELREMIAEALESATVLIPGSRAKRVLDRVEFVLEEPKHE